MKNENRSRRLRIVPPILTEPSADVLGFEDDGNREDKNTSRPIIHIMRQVEYSLPKKKPPKKQIEIPEKKQKTIEDFFGDFIKDASIFSFSITDFEIFVDKKISAYSVNAVRSAAYRILTKLKRAGLIEKEKHGIYKILFRDKILNLIGYVENEMIGKNFQVGIESVTRIEELENVELKIGEFVIFVKKASGISIIPKK